MSSDFIAPQHLLDYYEEGTPFNYYKQEDLSSYYGQNNPFSHDGKDMTTGLSDSMSSQESLSFEENDSFDYYEVIAAWGSNLLAFGRNQSLLIGDYVWKFLGQKELLQIAIAIVVILVTLSFGGYIAAKILNLLIRSPLKTFLGICYEQLEFSPLRFRIVMTEIEWRPSDSPLARTVLTLCFPSADVVTKAPDPEIIRECSQKRTKLSAEEFHSLSFKGSNITAQSLSLKASFQLTRFYFFKPRSQKETDSGRRRDVNFKSDIDVGADDVDLEEGLIFSDTPPSNSETDNPNSKKNQSKTISHWWYRKIRQRLSIRNWMNLLRLVGPYPMIDIQLEGLSIEIDKTYIAPDPPNSLLSNLSEASSNINSSFSTEQPLPLPAAVVRSSTYSQKKLPTFDQDCVLGFVKDDEISAANSRTFFIKRWLERSGSVGLVNGMKTNGRTDTPLSEGSSRNLSEDEIENANHKDIVEAAKRAEERTNKIIRSCFNILLRACTAKITDVAISIIGVDAETVRLERNQKSPHRASLALAELPRSRRAVTLVSAEMLSLFFRDDAECTAVLGIGGLAVNVGLPDATENLTLRRNDFQNENIDEFRFWHELVSPFDSMVEFAGLLPLLVYLVSYDHMWEERSLKLSLNLSEMTLSASPLHIHTVMAHLDDFIDPNAPYNEWIHWLSHRQLMMKKLSEDDLAAYRAYYKKVNGGKREQEIQNQPMQSDSSQPSSSELPPGDGTAVTAAEHAHEFERYMTRNEIMEQRCIAMKKIWHVPESCADFKAFLKATNSHLSRKEIEIYQRSDEEYSQNDDSPPKREFKSALFALEFFLRHKFDILAPLFSFCLTAEVLHIQIPIPNKVPEHSTVSFSDDVTKSDPHVDQSRSSDCDEGPPSETTSPKFIDTLPVLTTFDLMGIHFSINIKNPVFATSGTRMHSSSSSDSKVEVAGESLQTFQVMSLEVENIVWLPNEAADVASIWPKFLDGSSCGMLYMHPRKKSTSSSINLNIQWTVASIDSDDVHIIGDVNMGDFLLMANPMPLLALVEMLDAFSKLPFRDLQNEQKMMGISFPRKSSFTVDSFKTGGYTKSVETANDTITNQSGPERSNGTLLNGMSAVFSFTISNVSILFFPDLFKAEGGIIEFNLGSLQTRIDSGKELERYTFSASSLVCQAHHLHKYDDGSIKFFDLPLKRAVHIGSVKVGIKARSFLERKGDSGSNEKKLSQGVSIEVTTFVDSVIVSFCSTMNASFIQCFQSYEQYVFGSPEERARRQKLKDDEKEREYKQRAQIQKDHLAALNELILMFDKDKSRSLDAEEIKSIINHFFTRGKSQAGILTNAESQREVRYFMQLLNPNGHTDEIGYEEMNYVLLSQIKSNDTEDDAEMKEGLFFVKRFNGGLVYYDDLREFSSTKEVYRITGKSDSSKFLPPSAWRQGKGVELFWDLYIKETGCTYSSLCGQDIATVQRKLVRVLCNYDFAKFCWKSLVKPRLQVGPVENSWENVLISEWLLDSDTRVSNEKDGFVGLLNKRFSEGSLIDQNKERGKGNDIHPLLYDVKVLIEVDDITLSIGDSISITGPLFDVQMSGVNVCGNALLQSFPGNQIIFAPSSKDAQATSSIVGEETTEKVSDKSMPYSTIKKLASQPDNNELHFESRITAHYLMTKHNTMETFMEPFAVFGNVYYSSGKNCSDSNSKQDMDVRSFSAKLLCPHVLHMNGSPSCFETFNLVRDIISQSSPEVNNEMGVEEQIENLRNVWRHNNKELSEPLEGDEFSLSLKQFCKHQSRFRQPPVTDQEIDEKVLSIVRQIDRDVNGEISYANVERVIRTSGVIVSFISNSTRFDIRNMIGGEMKVCSRDFLDTHMHLHPAATYGDVLSLFDTIEYRHTNVIELRVDQSNELRSHKPQLILFVESFRPVYDIKISAYQSFMILLKRMKKVRRRRRAILHGARNVDTPAGFEPYLTIIPLLSKLDSIAFEVRTCLTIEAFTSVNVRIVDIGPSPKYLRRQKKSKGKPLVDLTRKNLRIALAYSVENSPIVFESHNLQHGSFLPVPFHIMNSSSYHALLIQDLTGVDGDVWRSPILLTRDFLFNSNSIHQVSQCHTVSGVSIKRDRLNVHRSEKKKHTDKKGTRKVDQKSKRKTAWNTTIEVLPSLMLLNALPFSVQFRCWQIPKQDEENLWTAREYSRNDSSSDDDSDADDLQPSLSGRSPPLTAGRHNANDSNRGSFLASDRLSKGSTNRLNGIDMNAALYMQISHDFESAKRNNRGGLSELVWTEPICIDLEKLRTGGNKSGIFSLRKIDTQLGDDADISLDVTVDFSGTPTCTLFAPYWVINKTGMKMSLKFTGRPETVHCSGCGGIPIIAQCNIAEKKLSSFNKKEISALPIESVSEQVSSVWWDEETNGKLVLKAPLLKRGGKSLVDWSQGVNLDAVGTQAEINCKDLIFGVSIDPLTGIFHRSHLITFSPRYIVKNLLSYAIRIIPMYGPFANVKRLTALLTKISGDKPEGKLNDANLKDRIVILQPGESTILCQFVDTSSRTMKSTEKPSTTTSQTKKKKLTKEQTLRVVCVQVDAPRWSSKEKWHMIPADNFDVTNFCERDGLFDRISLMTKAQVQKAGPSTVVSISHIDIDPFIIENRSSHQFLQFIQEDDEASMIELPPMTFCGYTWDNPHGKKRLRFVVVREHKSQQYLMEHGKKKASAQACTRDAVSTENREQLAALFSTGSNSYNPLEVGGKAFLPFAHKGYTGKLVADVKIVAGSRIFSFYDSTWRSKQLELGNLQSGGDWKNTSIEVAAEGAAFHLVDDFPREICSIVARELILYKAKGSIETTTILRNIQVDAMLSSARYPIILQQIPIGIDRNEYLVKDFIFPDEVFISGNRSLTRKDQFWLHHDEVPCPVFYCKFSFRPQNNMTWIPSIRIELSPMKVQIELEYLLRIVDLILNSIPARDSDYVIEADAIKKLEEVNGKTKYQTRSQGGHLTYVESVVITPVQFQLELDIKPETKDGDVDEDDVEGQSVLALSSMGKSTNSSVASGVLSWVTNVSSVFAHVSPTFQFKEVTRVDCYCNGEELLEEIARYYIMQTIYQSYKVLFSMRILGDPTKLLDMYRTGVVDLFSVTKDEVGSHGKQGVGKGVTSFVTNVFGGTFFFIGKVSGSLAELLDSISTNELSSDAYKPKSATSTESPDHLVDGTAQGVAFATKTIISGFAGLVGNPYRGMKKRSIIATAKGTASGVGGFVLAPFIGSLGFVAKMSEGVGGTINMLELSVIESRCRPARIVSWGSSIGSSGLPFLKAVGIRVHVMRYQRRRQMPGSPDGKGNHTNTSDFKKAKAEEEKRRNPKRKVISITRVKDKFHHLTKAAKPMLLEEEEEEDKSDSSKVSRYAVIFEETVVIRCADLQLSDHIIVKLWNYAAIRKMTTKTKPISACHITVGDIYASMEHFYKGKLQQIELNLTHRVNSVDGRSKSDTESGPTFMTDDMLSDLAEMRGVNHIEKSLEGNRKDTLLTPCIQEFIMMRPSSKTKYRNYEEVNDAIQGEISSIERAEEEALEFFDSDSSYSSDSSFSLDGRRRQKETVDLDELSRQMEHLHGTVTLSFFPIMW